LTTHGRQWNNVEAIAVNWVCFVSSSGMLDEVITSSMTSHPVRQCDPTQYQAKYKKKRVRRPKTSKDTACVDQAGNSASPMYCVGGGLSVKSSRNEQQVTPGSAAAAVMDNLLHVHVETSLQMDDKKQPTPANGRRPEKDLEMGVERSWLMTVREKLISMIQASDNKLAMKLFGNRNALMKERLRHRAANNWIIHPCSDFRCVLLPSLVLFYSA